MTATAGLPLAGLHIVEFEALGPGPSAGALLAQAGASVRLIVRPQARRSDGVESLLAGAPGVAGVAGVVGAAEADGAAPADPRRAGKQLVALDLKRPADRDAALDLIASADALIEGLRPGVMERLGLGPAACHARRPQLVYGRLSGWGQDGPLAQAAGHDLNYAALSGLLALGVHHGAHGGTTRSAPPWVPPGVVGDGAAALGLAYGIVCGVLRARLSGRGCVVDAAISELAGTLGSVAHWLHGIGALAEDAPLRAAPFYEVYRCADGGFVSIAALEPAFYAVLLDKLALHDIDRAAQYDSAQWPALRERFDALFASRPRAHWCALLEGSDACFAPVLDLDEAPDHPQHAARGSLQRRADGGIEGGPAPRWLDAAAPPTGSR